jgi:hypothetical protein
MSIDTLAKIWGNDEKVGLIVSNEVFQKVGEWCDLQEKIAGGSLFSILRLKPSGTCSRFRGNDRKRDCVETRIPKNLFETIYPTW